MAAGDGSRGDGSAASAGVRWLEACACVSPSPGLSAFCSLSHGPRPTCGPCSAEPAASVGRSSP